MIYPIERHCSFGFMFLAGIATKEEDLTELVYVSFEVENSELRFWLHDVE